MSVPYTDSEASEARQWSNRYGPPNAWTASFGTAARMIGRLLDERERLMAEAMLRERCRAGADCPASDNAPSHDAAPAARASEATASPERVRVRGDAGTGDTDHGASPEAIARVGRPRTDKADLPTRAGTGDTPATHATRGEGSERRERTEPVAWATFYPNGSAASVYVGRHPQHAEPLYRHPPCQDLSQKNLTLTDRERGAIERAVDSIASTMPYESQQGLADWKTLRGLLSRIGGEK